MGHQKVIEHPPAVVASEDVNPVVPGHDRMLAPPGANKLLAARQLLPAVNGFRRAEIQRQIFLRRHPKVPVPYLGGGLAATSGHNSVLD